MTYTPTQWKDEIPGVLRGTLVNASNMNKIEQGIVDNAKELDEHLNKIITAVEIDVIDSIAVPEGPSITDVPMSNHDIDALLNN